MTTYHPNRTRLLNMMTYISIGLVFLSSLMVFAYARPEALQGNAQKIFYVHLGTFFGSFVLFSVAVVGGVQFLRTRNNKWDILGLSTIEVGLAFALVNIVTGSIWARPIWNTWWTWDPRLLTVTIMWLTYAAYMMLRSGIEDPERRRRFAAVYSILAFSSVILTVVIIRVRPDTIHPVAGGPSVTSPDASGDFNMSPRVVQTLMFSIFTYIVVSITVAWHRIRLENRAQYIQSRKVELLLNA